ncbi:SUF system Fe-S cluster assembly regulator [Spiribacter sp. C176]|uniref:SUF system Fe-S cluster assembly regulator n=1 Tax=Spiribacter salilacus TaxID=2664894 RepID=A0A6N7QMX1_9GAMM|nr:SUF system Fe-S cluster assembly regulator [Spiribacter salilacus]MRH77382.1 SUF system Fe-S cluster assembly regulator [Spiribacter salilacus]
MIRLNRETDYGFGILTLMAKAPEERFNAAYLAEKRGLPQPVVSKILKQLTRSGVLVSYRGAKGGYGLARAPEQLTVAALIMALEGPIALTDCIEEGRSACQYGAQCTVSGVWNHINDVVSKALSEITLAEMAAAESGAMNASIQTLEYTGVRHVREH